jgi:hypothetical protein
VGPCNVHGYQKREEEHDKIAHDRGDVNLRSYLILLITLSSTFDALEPLYEKFRAN